MKKEQNISDIKVNFELISSYNIKLGDFIKLKKGDMFILSDKKIDIFYPNFGKIGKGRLVIIEKSIAIIFDEIFLK